MSEIDDRESIKRSARKGWTNLYFCCKIKEAKARGFYMSNKNFYQSVQVLKNYETDFKQEVKPSVILGFFQEAASENSEEAGFGYSSLAPLGTLRSGQIAETRRENCRTDMAARAEQSDL